MKKAEYYILLAVCIGVFLFAAYQIGSYMLEKHKSDEVLKDAGINVVLCNSNPATIMTDQAMADEIYLEPQTVETVNRIIKKDRPESILAGLGGQTGLNLAMQLEQKGVL